MRIAFIGLGHMGGPMSRRLAEAGFDLTVYDLDPAQGAAAVRAGARRARTAAAAVDGAGALLTSLPTPAVIEEVMLGAGRVLEHLPAGALWVDLSTSVPAVADRVRRAGSPRGVRALDAPVSGMTKGAESGTLRLYVGGDGADIERIRPVLSVLAARGQILHVGGHGAGYAVKLMLNLLWFDSLLAVAEVLTIGTRAGVDLAVLHQALVGSQANSVLLEHDLLPLLRDGDYEEGFAVALACKDLGLAVDLARSVGVPAEVSALAEQVFRRARALYGDEAGEMSPVRLYEDAAGTKLRLPASPSARRAA
ncbi:MAG TPA: NAD(P)-dependent oxidoreductase [Thermoleophilia bacterium]|nr:NAD(P)-dependent oxidoreductase [Thermoleophilia bacterium]